MAVWLDYLLDDSRVQGNARRGRLLSKRAYASKVISSVVNGSLEEAFILASFINRVDQSQITESLSALLNFTKKLHVPENVPPEWTDEEKDSIRIVFSVTSAIGNLFLLGTNPRNPMKLEDVCEALPPHYAQTLYWIRYFAENSYSVIPLVNRKMPQTSFMIRLTNVFASFSRCERALTFFYSRDACQLGMDLWILDRKDDFMEDAIFAISELMVRVFENMLAYNKEALRTVLEGCSERAVKIGLYRLRHLLRKKPRLVQKFYQKLVGMLYILHVSVNYLDLCKTSFKHEYISTSISASHALLDDPGFNDRNRILTFRCVEQMPMLMHNTDGFHCLLKVARCGFLNLLRRIVGAIELSDTERYVMENAMPYFHMFSSLYSFIDVVPGDMVDVDPKGKAALSSKNERFVQNWDITRGSLCVRNALKIMYKRWLKKKKAKCEACSLETGRKIYMCSGCEDVFYCSRRCQRLSWIRGHNLECQKLKAQLEGVYPREWLTRRDREFFQIVATVDIRRFSSSLLTLAKIWLPFTPTHRIGYSIDYTIYPAKLDVFDIALELKAALADAPNQAEANRLKALGTIDATKGAGQFIKVIASAARKDLEHIPTIIRPRFINGMTFEVPYLHPFAIRSGRNHVAGPLTGRSAREEYDLTSSYDELDEVIHRMNVQSGNLSGRECDPRDLSFEMDQVAVRVRGMSSKDIWADMVKAIDSMEKRGPDWPFVN